MSERDGFLINCSICGEILQEPGGIIIASPTNSGMCSKYHVCVKCEELLVVWMVSQKLNLRELPNADQKQKEEAEGYYVSANGNGGKLLFKRRHSCVWNLLVRNRPHETNAK